MNYNYSHYLKRVADLVAEPLPHDPSLSLATWQEVAIDTKLEIGEPIQGITIPGWMNFNRLTRGFRSHEFSILCGPTGCGKTTLLANMAVSLASQECPILVGSIETGKNDFHRVMAGILGGEDPYLGWDPERIRTTFKSHRVLESNRQLYCRYDSRVPHRRLLADLLYAHETYGTKIALFDNLNFLMEIKNAKDAVTVMDQAIHDFVVFVKKCPVHVVMVTHPNKDGIERVDHEGHIKGSSTAVQEAANVIVWNRLSDPTCAPQGQTPEWCREMKFLKVRKNGRAVGSRIVYSIDRRSPRLTEERFL